MAAAWLERAPTSAQAAFRFHRPRGREAGGRWPAVRPGDAGRRRPLMACVDTAPGTGAGWPGDARNAPVRTVRPSGPYFTSTFAIADATERTRTAAAASPQAGEIDHAPAPETRPLPEPAPSGTRALEWAAPTRRGGFGCREGPSAPRGTRRMREGAPPSSAAPPRRLRRTGTRRAVPCHTSSSSRN